MRMRYSRSEWTRVKFNARPYMTELALMLRGLVGEGTKSAQIKTRLHICHHELRNNATIKEWSIIVDSKLAQPTALTCIPK